MRKLALLIPSSLLLAALLTGCGIDSSAVNSSSQGALAIKGQVLGGQQGVYLSTIQLYSVGNTGNGSAASPLISQSVKTDQYGSFGITGDYTCPSATTQVYIVATGGQAIPGTNNPALVMVDALGSCGNLTSASFVTINEVTTMAAAWALAPFMQASYTTPGSVFMPSYANVGSSSTNATGIANAFLDSHLLADTGTGKAATIASTLTVEAGKLYAMADVLASCINSNGTTGCSTLFAAATPTGGTAPADTLSAALNIVKNPGQNPSGVFNVIGTTPPFPTTLTQAPNDWTITLAVTGGGINAPTAIDIDTKGDVWAGGYYGLLTEVSPQGAPLSGTGFGSGVLNEVYGLTIDLTTQNIWVTNEESNPNSHGSLSEFLGSNSSTPGTLVANGGYGTFWDSSIDYPVALSADTNGNIFISDYANSSATVYSSGGGVVATGLGGAYAAFPVAVAADSSHGVWIANLGDNTVTHVDQNGNLLSNLSCCNGANGIATDALGNAWVANYYGNSFSEVSSANGSVPAATLINNASIVGPSYNSYPAGIAVDAGQNVWIANYRGESISELSGALSTTPGTMLSPLSGFGYAGPPPASPLLLLPYGIVPDQSGNIWVSNFGNNNLIMFFGVATPTMTPTRPTPTAP